MVTKKLLRRGLIALFALACVLTLTLALGSLSLPVRADDLVLDGNTAKYEFINDTSEQTAKNSSLWTYNRTTNEWTSSKKKSGSALPADMATANKLTLKVTEAGDIALKWKVNSTGSAAVAIKHYTNVVDGRIEGLTPTYALNKGYQFAKDPKDYKYRLVFDEASYQGDMSSGDQKYQELTVTNCAVNDIVTIEFILAYQNSYSSKYMTVQGLTVPDTQFPITAKIAEGKEGLGSIRSDKEQETPQEGALTVKRGYGESVTFTATPNDENVYAYWTDSEGKKISVNGELKITDISDKDNNTTYIAHFATIEDMKPVSAGRDDGTEYWTYDDESGRTTLKLGLDYKTGEQPSFTFGIFVPEGGGYLEIDYTYWTADDLNATQLTLEDVYMRGSSSSTTAASWLGYKSNTPYFALARTTHDEAAERPTEKYLQWIGGSGYFSGKINIQMGFYEYTDGDEFSINSIKVVEKPTEFEDLTLDFSPELTTMTMKYQGKDEEIPVLANQPVKVPVGITNIAFSAKQTSETKASKYDSSRTVKYYTYGFSAEKITKTITDRSGTTQKPYENYHWTFATSYTFYFTYFSKTGVAFQSSGTSDPLSTNDHVPYKVEESKVKVIYAEEVPLSVTVTKMSDGRGEDETLEDGADINLPFGHVNSVTLTIKNLTGFTADDISILVDDEERNSELQAYGDVFLFPLQVEKRMKLELSYLKKNETEDVYTKTKLTFTVGEDVGGDFKENLDHTADDVEGDFTLDNDKANPWLLDSKLSEEGNYAYGLAVGKEKQTLQDWGTGEWSTKFYGVNKVSNLKFALDGAESGSLSFQFQVSGYYEDSTATTGCARSGQLWWRSGSQFTTLDNSKVGTKGASEQSWFEELDGATMLGRPETRAGGGMEYGNGVVALGGGWYETSIPIQKGTPVYLGFLVSGVFHGYEENTYCTVAIRNVRLVTGTKNVTLKICGEAPEGAKATATENDTPHVATQEGTPFSVNAGSIVHLTAELGDGEFYGWSVDGVLMSRTADTSIFINNDSEIMAWIAPAEAYTARAEGKFFKTIEDAAEGAALGDTVYVMKDNVKIDRSFTIGTGVTLLLPYNDEGGFTESGTTTTAENHISWFSPNLEQKQYRHLTVTVTNSAKITVQGTLRVGGIVNLLSGQGYQGHTSGAYAEMILEKGSSIQIAKGGVMDVYGRVWGGEDHKGEDMGTIDVAEGGKLYEPFMILDFSGGSNTLNLFMSEQTPFKRYAMVNIEVPFTVHYGAQLLGHASLFVSSMNLLTSLDQPFISYDMGDGKGGDGTGANTFVMLQKGASVTVTYDREKIAENNASNGTEGIGETTMRFEGGATFCDMRFSAMGLTVPTTGVYFSIPYNFQIEMNAGKKSGAEIDQNYNQYETKTDFKIMPGASVKVGAGAKLTLNANAYVLDGLIQTGMSGKSYPSATDLHNAGYNTNGTLIVDGTLEIGIKTPVKKFEILGSGGNEDFDPTPRPATFLGVVQTTGKTGKIIIPKGAILKGTIIDGANAAYDCNYFENESSLRLFDKTHGEHGTLLSVPVGEDNKAEQAMTFSATWEGTEAEWTLENIQVKYEKGNGQHAEGEHKELVETTLEKVTGLSGSWRLDHAEHEYDWTYNAETDGTLEPNKTNTIRRDCNVFGCEEQGEAVFFGAPSAGDGTNFLGSLTYCGGAFGTSGASQLEALFKALYKDAEFPATVQVTASGPALENAVNVQAEHYHITVTLEGGFFLVDGAFKNTLDCEWAIAPFDLSGASVSLSSSSGEYSGDAHTPTISSALVDLVGRPSTPLTGNDYAISFEGDRVNVGSFTVKLTGQGNYSGAATAKYEITAKELTLIFTTQHHTYSGEKPEVLQEETYYTLDGVVKDERKDLTVTLALKEEGGVWSVGDYELTATLGGTASKNYTLKLANEKTALHIDQKSIGEGQIALTADGATYDGTEKKLFSAFTLTGFDPQPDTDYRVSYSANTINVGQVTVTVEGQGNFTGTVTKTYQIAPYSIKNASSNAKVHTEGESLVYNGSPHTPTVDFTSIEDVTGSITFELSYDSNTEAGEAKVTVKGTNNFCDSFELTFTIARATLTVTPESKYSPQGQATVALTATHDGLLEKDREAFERERETIYSLQLKDYRDEVGNYEIEVTVLKSEWGSYTVVAGDGKDKYNVTSPVFGKVTFQNTQSITYDGQGHTFNAQNVKLESQSDIHGSFGEVTFTYQLRGGGPVGEMKNAGTYTVTAHLSFNENGGAHYEGTISTEFTIDRKNIANADISLESTSLTYTGKVLQPKVTEVKVDGLTLTADEYSVTWESNTAVTEAAVVKVTANEGNFIGSATENFAITARDISEATVTVQGSDFTYQAKEYTPKVTVTLMIGGESVTLTESDYALGYQNNQDVGDATITVTGQGNYTGSPAKETKFTITAKSVTVTIEDQTATYSGTALPVFDGSSWRVEGLAGTEEKDVLGVTLHLVVPNGGKWSVGTHTDAIDGSYNSKNYTVSFEKGDLEITKKTVTAEIADKSSQYGDSYEQLTFTLSEDALAQGDEESALGITLKINGLTDGGVLNQGSYSIDGSYSSDNYTVLFHGSKGTSGSYEVKLREITITIENKSGVYKNAEFDVTSEKETDWKVTTGSIYGEDELHVVLSKEEGKDVRAEGYAITGSFTESNYNVTWVDGTFTVTPRPVTVEIESQSDTFNYLHKYTFDDTKWRLAEDAELASGENKDVLAITLSVTLTDAGEYAIKGASGSTNYAVTFAGDYHKEGDPLDGKAGLYTVGKLDVTEDAIFFPGFENDVPSQSDGETAVRVRYTGDELVFHCVVTYFEGEVGKDLDVTYSDPFKFNGVGTFTVTVTIDDTNYSGSSVFTVIVTDADGYTERLKTTLDRLKTLAEGKTADTLTAEDFADLKEMYDLLNALDEEEKAVAESKLAAYEELVDAWNDRTDIEDIVETAEELALSPIQTLFEAAAALTLLAGLAYVALKGGIL